MFFIIWLKCKDSLLQTKPWIQHDKLLLFSANEEAANWIYLLLISKLSVSNYTYQNFFPDIWESLNLK